jgi:mannosyltransferase
MEPRDRMGKTHVGRLITLSFIVLLGAGLRFYGIARESLWMDEATTVRCADLALSEIWSQPCDTSPPLYYALQRAWLLFGRSEAALRSLSAVVATLSILITYALGRHLAGTGAGLLSAGLLATSALHVEYSQEARSYALLIAACTFAIWGLVRILSAPEEDDGSRFRLSNARRGSIDKSAYVGWFAFVLGSVVALYAHNTAALLIILSNFVLCCWWAVRRRFSRRFFLAWLLANLIILGAWSWWLPVIIHQVGLELQDFWLEQPSPLTAIDTVANVYGQMYLSAGQPYVTGAFIGLGVLGLTRLFLLKPWPAILLAVFFVCVPIMTYIISFHTPIFMLRTILWPLPPFLTLVAIGIVFMRPWPLPTTVIAVAIGIQSTALANYFSYTIRREPWDEIVQAIQTSAHKHGVVIFCGADGEIPFSYYAVRSQFLIPMRGIVTFQEPAWRKLTVHEPISHIRTIGTDRIREFVNPFPTVWLIERFCEPSASIRDELSHDYDLLRSDWMGGLRVTLFSKKS